MNENFQRFLHYYESDSDFQTDYNGEAYVEPWVSLTKENEDVNYNKKGDYTINVTYVDRGHSGDPVVETYTGEAGSPVSFTAKSAPAEWANHEFMGWATVEYPTYEQTQEPGFIKEPGRSASASADTTFYAVYAVYFQGLIDEGYVNLDVYHETLELGIAHCMFIKPNSYDKGLVLDFDEVFDSAQGKLVSTAGVVGEGTAKNAFIFKDTSEHWLTDDEWYDIYNNRQLSHSVASWQFYGLDWSDKESVTIKYDAGWSVGVCICGPNMPRVLNIYMNNGMFGYMNKTFGDAAHGCGSEVINFSKNGGGLVDIVRKDSSFPWIYGCQATFEGCNNLKQITGLNFVGMKNWCYAFDHCNSMEIYPISTFGSEMILEGGIVQTFRENTSLVTIEPDLIVSAATDTSGAFYHDINLTNVHLKGINAAANNNAGTGYFAEDTGYTWILSATSISQASVDYMVTNLTEYPGFDGSSYKNIALPNHITLTSAQISRLNTNGWKAYYGDGTEIPARDTE